MGILKGEASNKSFLSPVEQDNVEMCSNSANQLRDRFGMSKLNDEEMEYNVVTKPKHYNREGAMETIDEMELLFGLQATYDFCRLNAWKYRARANAKNGEEDMQKSDWYIRKASEIKTRMKMEGIYERRTESI